MLRMSHSCVIDISLSDHSTYTVFLSHDHIASLNMCVCVVLHRASAYVEVTLSLNGVRHFECRFQIEGGIAHQPMLVSENWSVCPLVWYQNIRSPSFSFVTIHASGRQTDRITTAIRMLHYMQSHGNNTKSLGFAF